MTIEELQRQVRQLKEDKGFEITLKQRLAYSVSEVGEVAAEVLKPSRDGKGDVGEMDPAETETVLERPGMQIYDVFWNLLDLAGVDLEDAVCKKAQLNVGREW